MSKKVSSNFEWIELYKYNVCSYEERYNNKCYDILKENNIEYLNQLEMYPVYNVDKQLNCTVYVQLEDYEKGIKLLRKNDI